MARRCQDCRHWSNSVFLGEGANGGACWEGDCGLGVGSGPRGRNSHRDRPRHSLMLACEKFAPETCSGCNAEVPRAAKQKGWRFATCSDGTARWQCPACQEPSEKEAGRG